MNELVVEVQNDAVRDVRQLWGAARETEKESERG